MFDKLQRLSDDGFNDAVVGFQANARAVNSTLAYLGVQAILHYYEHSRDISRCRHLYDAIEEVHMGRQLTAFTKVLRACTPQTGIGTDSWKGGKADAKPPEGYESILAKLVNEEGEGVGSQLMRFAEAPKTKGDGKKKGGTKAPVLKLPDSIPEAAVNSIQRELDGKTPEQVTAILTAASKPAGPEFKDPKAQELFEEFLVNAHRLEELGDTESSYIYKDGEKEEIRKTTAAQQLIRILSQARGFSSKVLGDFGDLQQAVKDAAQAEAA